MICGSCIALGTTMPPSMMADAILDAMESAEPPTRYIVGPDAEQLLGLKHSKSDRELDAIILGAYRAADPAHKFPARG